MQPPPHSALNSRMKSLKFKQVYLIINNQNFFYTIYDFFNPFFKI